MGPKSDAKSARGQKGRGATHFVALLRGINVGGKNKLRMVDLVSVFDSLGCVDVRTYVQSGNVVFSADPKLAAQLAERVSAAITARFELVVPVLLRTADEWRDALELPPTFHAVDPEQLHVAFLAERPASQRTAKLDATRSPGDTFVCRGREIYLHLPNGVARTKLTNAYFDSTLATTSSLRNWRTVNALAALLDDT